MWRCLQVCFENEGREYHLFVADKVRGELASNPSRLTQGKWSAVGWLDEKKDYAPTSEGDAQSLERLL